jgi:hypothetical protein
MENKKKINPILFYFFPVLILSCMSTGKIQILNSDLLYYDTQKKLTLKITDDGEQVLITRVKTADAEKTLEKSINPKTFNLLCKFKADSEKIANKYYIVNPVYNYFKDNKRLYFFENKSKPWLIDMGTVNSYQVLGGLYLKTGNKIYCRALQVKDADTATFKVMHVIRPDSEWLKSVGIDKNYIYNEDQIMTKALFDRLYWTKKDSLKAIYYERLR